MLSIIVPVYNEEATIAPLCQELSDVAAQNGYDLDLVFVDDGSHDGSWEQIADLCASEARVRGIRFRRNFGKAAALNAGFDAARGDLVMTLDADLQDDPSEIPRFLGKIDEGYDVVSGWKRVRHDPWHKVLPSRIFNWLVGCMTGVRLHDHNCGFKCYRREIFREVRLYGELHRFVPVLAAAKGWRVGEIVVHHRPREFGQSKYGLKRIPKGFLDLMTVTFLTGYGQRPQHLLGTIGLLGFFVGAVGITLLTAWWFISRAVVTIEPIHLHQRAIFYYSLAAALLGSQFMSIGLLAEMIAARQNREFPNYSTSERAGSEEAWQETPAAGV